MIPTSEEQEDSDEDMPHPTQSQVRTKNYNEAINYLSKNEESDSDRWEFSEISKWKDQGQGIKVLVNWIGYPPTWEPLKVIYEDAPEDILKFAKEHTLLHHPKWIKVIGEQPMGKHVALNTYRVMLTSKRKKTAPKFKFGQKVPRTIQECYNIDKENGNDDWMKAVYNEVTLLRDKFTCFKILKKDEQPPAEYLYIKLLWTFDIKVDGRKRARCVAGGHMTAPLDPEEKYFSVVCLDTIRCIFIVSVLMDLQVVAADIGSAYIQAKTKEKVYTIAGPEFGKIEGQALIVDKALYGLQSSANCWGEKLADDLRDMGFQPSKADANLWMRKHKDIYDYVCVYVDDLLVASKEPQNIIEPLKEKYGYELKGVGEPEYYNGGDISRTPEGKWEFSAKTYVKNVCEKIEKLLDISLKNYGSPMETGDHPEVDETDLLDPEQVSIYQMLIGCAQWAVTIGRFDIQYATITMAKYGQMPREGHLKRVLRIFGYLKNHYKHRILVDVTEPDYSGFKFMEYDWKTTYPGACEDFPDDAPAPVCPNVKITCYCDASHGCDLLTRRSVTGILICVNKTPVKWYCKRQNTVESSTYGSELVAARIAVELIMEVRYRLRMIGIPIEGPSALLIDNESVVKNTTLPSSTLKKKHNAIAYHKVREAVASGIIRVAHVKSKDNIADILTKPLSPQDVYNILKWILFKRAQPMSQGE